MLDFYKKNAAHVIAEEMQKEIIKYKNFNARFTYISE